MAHSGAHHSSPFALLSARLATSEGVYCGVTLEPYIQIKRGESVLSADDVPEEGSAEGLYQLRSRWYRSPLPRGGAFCSIHPEREAALQCVVCVRMRQGQHLSYHCTPECLKTHWHLHREYHKPVPSNGGLLDGASDASRGGKNDGSLLDSWTEVGRKAAYTPTLDDVGYTLKYECCVMDKLHPHTSLGKVEVVHTTRVRPTPTPPIRNLVQLVPPTGPHGSVNGSFNAGRFTVLTYNLLADLYAKADFNSTCPAWSLHWHYRKRNLLREIVSYKADILCLQEVQSDAYIDFWAPELQRAGYVAIYKKKTTEVYSDNKYTIDGCATFFRRERFSLVKKYEVEFNKAALSLADQMNNQTQKKNALARLLKDNVALIAVLEALEPFPDTASSKRTLICVANTHIHANPELNDVKLWQVHTLLKGLEKIAASADIPMLVAGDFNSTPGSMAHSLLVKGKVENPETCNDPLNLIKDQKITHSLPLSSAYAAMANASPAHDHRLIKQRARLDSRYHEPLFTNVTKDFRGTLDYILYTNTSLQPTAVLELPLLEGEVLSKPDEQLPNAQYSSDHLALLAEFQLLQRTP